MNTLFLTSCWDKLEKQRPLVHFITNYVTVNDCANAALACGASPVMADAIDEVGEMTREAQALVLNTGTLNRRIVESMLLSGRTANESHIPVILDPVGVGATSFRRAMIREILEEVHPSVIRGNASEISVLGLGKGEEQGVDAKDAIPLPDKIESARKCAVRYHCVVISSGKEDVIIDGEKVVICTNGDPLMTRVTGTGCMGSALLGALCGANKNNIFESAVTAAAAIGIAGEISADQEGARGLGHFHMGIIDAISRLTGEVIAEKVKIHEEL